MFFAPAKINLYLHITGRRADGYHDLDSLVVFTGIGDEVRIDPAENFEFAVDGPQAAALQKEPPENNLVYKAAHELARLAFMPMDMKITLTKRLPVASGIGGGSSDAAAALRGLAKHWGLSLDDPNILTVAKELGQDVPVCMKIKNNYIIATGTAPAQDLPRMGVVLVNPNKPLPTPAVYQEYRTGKYPFSPKAQLKESPKDFMALILALKSRRNDLQAPAMKLLPEIGKVIEALEKTGSCLLARMSGSGATCFGLFFDEDRARLIANSLRTSHPTWWVESSYLPY